MSWKRSSVSMPRTTAGIMGITADTKLGGIEMSPKTIVIGIVVFIVLVKILDLFIVLG